MKTKKLEESEQENSWSRNTAKNKRRRYLLPWMWENQKYFPKL